MIGLPATKRCYELLIRDAMAKSTSASPDGTSVGIDIGGTFTDVVLRTSAASHILKVPTIRAEPGRAVIAALDEIANRMSVPMGAITSFTHGSTIATNAVLERKGARVGLVTTEGFRDILEIGRQIRRQMYDLNLKPETPGWLAPGARRVEVRERIGSAGQVLVPLDEASLATAIDKLKAERVEAVAVSLLFSFLNPAHEQRVRAAIEAAMPGVPVSLSSEVDPVFREYERTVVTTFDAYVKPIVRHYLANMEEISPRPACRRRCRSCSPAAVSPAAPSRDCGQCGSSFRDQRPAPSAAWRPARRPASTTSSPSTSAAPRAISR